MSCAVPASGNLVAQLLLRCEFAPTHGGETSISHMGGDGSLTRRLCSFRGIQAKPSSSLVKLLLLATSLISMAYCTKEPEGAWSFLDSDFQSTLFVLGLDPKGA